MKVVVAGGGIIGCSTVYYLAQRGVACVLIERQTVASCASGKAGGFLTRDWCNEFEWAEFARHSFDMHMELSEKLPNCDYRRLESVSVSVGIEEERLPGEDTTVHEEFVYVPDEDEETAKPAAEAEKEKPVQDCAATGAAFIAERRNSSVESDPACVPDWMDGDVTYATKTGSPADIAQVHPRKLCEALLDEAKRLVSVEVVTGRAVTGFQRAGVRVVGVRLDNEETISGDAVVIAMGPWSLHALQWLGLPPMIGSCRGHSLLLRPSEADWNRLTATAVFAEMRNEKGKDICMEVYPRPDKTVYICGFSDFLRLPMSGDAVVPNESSIRQLRENVGQVSSLLAASPVAHTQACLMPKSSDDRFLIGAVPGVRGAFLGTAHSYWGILCGPATGLALTELIVDGRCESFDLSPFNPSRFFAARH